MAKTDLIAQYSTADVPTADMGQTVDQLMRVATDMRKNHERRWYDNNFFDDGYHFRYLSRTQNKIVDLSERATLWNPLRAIPKASRQIRGVANLLVSQDYTPIVYPEKINTVAFPNPQEYKAAVDEAKRIAQASGHWLSEELKKHNLIEKIAHLVLLSAKHSVAWMQIWGDPVKEKICIQVYDAFDIYTLGNITEVEDEPFIGKGIPKIIADIKANEYFDKAQLEKINPDNKHASSEIKEAYMRSRYGRDYQTDQTATLILKEFYIKEYLNSANRDRIARQEDGGDILQGKKEGDMLIRQVFSAGNIWLRDTYVNLPSYPFVDFRFEPGPMYQVPLIERFIPQNKSYDMFMSRAEKFAHTMTVGAWAKKSGEQYKVSNDAGGQVVEYQTTPPAPMALPTIPAFYFQIMQMVQSNMEEQGVSTSILGKVPQGVKANAAIESLKESEYASLVIPQRRLKEAIKRIAEKMLDIADDHFVSPQTVYYLEKGEPQYFDVIGNSALKKRKDLKVDNQPIDAVPLKADCYVDIEVQAGMAYTREGQKAAAKELGDYMVQLAQLGVLPVKVVSIFMNTMLETYKFGPTKEVMEAMAAVEDQGSFTDEQIQTMKIAVVEVFKDLISKGVLPDQQTRINETKVAVAEVVKDAGLVDGAISSEIEAKKSEHEMALEDEEHQLTMAEKAKKLQIAEAKAAQDMQLKQQEKEQQMKIKEAEAQENMRIKEKMAKAKAKMMKEQPKEKNATTRK